MQDTHKVALCLAALASLAAASCQPNGAQPTSEPPSEGMYEYERPPPSGEQPTAEEQMQPSEGEQQMAQAEEPIAPAVTEEAQEFIDEVTHANMAQVEMGQLALVKARKKPVQQLAQKMVDEHGRLNQQLTAAARDKGARVVEELDDDAREDMDKLDKVTGNEFDSTYLEIIEDDHEELVEDLREQSEQGDDPDLRTWAAQTLPTIEEHVAHIQAVRAGKPYRPSPPQASVTPEQY